VATKTPAPQRAGTRGDIDGDAALRLIGDDPATMLMAIALMERLIAKRERPRRPRG
jgi:hypothetical protein